uniref:Uncharacterized protein n=1 Tax=Ananas comosus var. bracteatus TaxID=296719 RepID=A0A6V7Q666_ANACO|nr:unnamed protein product [Ananas comosus var. bracteatus]
MNTKVVRWKRLLYMYLLGHANEVRLRGINLNVPFFIWHRMAQDIKTSNQNGRLPYPLLIMRILWEHGVDAHCSSYEHSLGMINETTLIKSRTLLRCPPRRSLALVRLNYLRSYLRRRFLYLLFIVSNSGCHLNKRGFLQNCTVSLLSKRGSLLNKLVLQKTWQGLPHNESNF